MMTKIKIAITFIIVIFSIVSMTIAAVDRANERNKWFETRAIKTVVIEKGDTLDGIGYRYKPDWLDIREYRQMIIDLNDIKSEIIPGQLVHFYVCGEHYTSEGLVMDNGQIITTDGNIWSYDNNTQKGCVNITFSDNGTPFDIYDDIIIDVKK